MLKIIKQSVPLETQGILNRLRTESADMTVNDNIPKGGYFILHNTLYKALRAIPAGSMAKPQDNCIAKSLTELGGN